jgi:transcriptional regulator with XRE-family HTH domain
MAQANQKHTLGAALRAARQRAGLSLRQLEEQTGVPRSTIMRLERDEPASPNPTALQHLARALEVPSADLFLLAGIPVPAERPSLPAMLRSDYDLPPEAVEEVRRSIERIARKYRKRPVERQEDL